MTRENIALIMLDSTKRLHNAAPEFYPSSVQQQIAANEMYAVSSLAHIYADQGNFHKAEVETQRAMELAEAYRLDEYNPLQARPGLRQTEMLLARLGIIQLQQGFNWQAVEYLRQSVAIGEKGLEYYSKYSEAADFRWDLATGLQALSVAYIKVGSCEAALNAAQSALAPIEVLVSATPNDSHLRRTHAQMLSSVGDACFENGRFIEASENFHSAYTVIDQLLVESPDDLYLMRLKSICMERFGNIAVNQKDYASAVQIYTDTLEVKRQLVEADDANWDFQSDFQIIAGKLEAARARAEYP